MMWVLYISRKLLSENMLRIFDYDVDFNSLSANNNDTRDSLRVRVKQKSS